MNSGFSQDPIDQTKPPIIDLDSLRPFYRNPFTHELRPLLIRTLHTPISQARSNDFPSPTGGDASSSSKNYQIIPNFEQDREGRWIESRAYLQAHFKSIDKMR